MRHRFSKVVLGLALFALLAGTSTVAAKSHHAAASSYNVGFIYPRTGLLGAYGAEEIEGFKLGLQYATNGTGKVNGKTINVTYDDDKGDPATGVSEAKDLIGQGYKILMGTGSSGVALQIAPLAAQNQILYISGPAAYDGITGINKYTFRAGRQTYQDVLDAASFLGKTTGKKVVVFDQDSVFGHGNYAAVKAVLGGKGHNVSEISVPLSATDFTPFALQAKQANADLVRRPERCGTRSTSRAPSMARRSSPASPSGRPGRRQARPRRRSSTCRTTFGLRRTTRSTRG